METKELLQAYKTISKIMKEEGFEMRTQWAHVKAWLSNKICDQLSDGDIIEK